MNDTTHISQPACLQDIGSGRAILVLIERGPQSARYSDFVRLLGEKLSQRQRFVVLESSLAKAENWREDCDKLEAILEEKKIRQFSIVGVAAASTLAQELTLRQARKVRTLTLVDATTRPHPSLFSRAIDGIEGFLPLGLPLRGGTAEFDGRSLLHRLRSPTLVVLTPYASAASAAQLDEIVAKLPTAQAVILKIADLSELTDQAAKLVESFQDTPAKCPQ
jgi:pimeloyl-ACP methyl ester carboxylesterase